MALTDKAILALKPTGKKFKVSDGDGLYILVHPKGGKYWYMKYHFAGRPQEIAFGTYPAVSLELARERRDDARQQLARDLNPRLEKKAAKEARTVFSPEWVLMMSGRARIQCRARSGDDQEAPLASGHLPESGNGRLADRAKHRSAPPTVAETDRARRQKRNRASGALARQPDILLCPCNWPGIVAKPYDPHLQQPFRVASVCNGSEPIAATILPW